MVQLAGQKPAALLPVVPLFGRFTSTRQLRIISRRTRRGDWGNPRFRCPPSVKLAPAMPVKSGCQVGHRSYVPHRTSESGLRRSSQRGSRPGIRVAEAVSGNVRNRRALAEPSPKEKRRGGWLAGRPARVADHKWGVRGPQRDIRVRASFRVGFPHHARTVGAELTKRTWESSCKLLRRTEWQFYTRIIRQLPGDQMRHRTRRRTSIRRGARNDIACSSQQS
jgi:hypothetical protein